MYCDLHTHSHFSDGSHSPAWLISQAKELDLAIALTDHNTVAGLPEFLAEAERQGVRAVPGIEFSTVCSGKELHLVGLFIESSHFAYLESVAEDFHRRKAEANREMVRRLNAAGYEICYDALLAKSLTGNINRAHMANALVEKGYMSTPQEAFEKLLGDNLPIYVSCQRLETAEAVRILWNIKAVPVLAHPLQELTEEGLRKILPELKDAGLIGLETHHSSYDDATIAKASAIAREFDLLPSGGSDFHGQAKPDIRLGAGKGNLCIPITFLENLEQIQRML
jgi:predicted metal-dependent phosphoesterase TrpH